MEGLLLESQVTRSPRAPSGLLLDAGKWIRIIIMLSPSIFILALFLFLKQPENRLGRVYLFAGRGLTYSPQHPPLTQACTIHQPGEADHWRWGKVYTSGM